MAFNPNNAPGGAEVWEVDGGVYLVYFVPGSNPPVPMAWHIRDPKTMQGLFGDQKPPITKLSGAQAAQRGWLKFGTTDELKNTSEHPFDVFNARFEEEAKIRPWLRDPEILAKVAGAELEGRTLTDAEWKNTEWYRSRTEGERAWAEMNFGDPATAKQRLASNRVQVRDLLYQAGYEDPPESLVSRLADEWTMGVTTEAQMRDSLRRETDPYAPGASPFAGRYLPEGAEVVRQGDNYYVRTAQGDYRMTGPGQVARYGDGATTFAPDGQHVVFEGRHYLVTGGKHYQATGEGQLAGLERLYGSGKTVKDVKALGAQGGKSVVDYFGGPGGIERSNKGAINEVGEASQILSLPDTTALGEEERVRALLVKWLGPRVAAQYGDAWIAEHAGLIRNGGPGAEDQIVEKLRAARMSLLPNYDPNLSYDDIAGPFRAEYEQFAGTDANEATDPMFMKLLQQNDAVVNQRMLRQEGLKRGWAPVLEEATQAMGSAFGGQVRGIA